ncbi:TetR family transcriptional regulator [Desulfovibrio sp. Huiquan2017]|uniref:TetR family transcriptional regulator n=1 Tax=Desulfovibrio sp. Huiquan2017 TaxID=2816861 RepID=UPI001A91B565|nr:TetR family transcriptional regulator [Desulfovibrio sp. Huiquan2017]
MTNKERIFLAGAELFAKGTYDSVGIREIAQKADANSAMISYYFGNKTGLLREIFIRFKQLLSFEIRQAVEQARDTTELCSIFVRKVIKNARANRNIYLVGLRELNRDSAELQDLRTELVESNWEFFYANAAKFKISGTRAGSGRPIVLTGILGLIFSDYLLGGGDCIDQKAASETYVETITLMLQLGLPGYWA